MKLSVITPSFNQGRFIERTIQSVLKQNVDLEYLVIDGGSTDETLQILERYGSNIYWISEADRGQAHAVNKGILRSSGEIICWLNSDDVYFENTLHFVNEYFTKNPKQDIIYGCAYHIDENDKIINPYPTKEFREDIFFNECFLCQPAVFFRRRVIDNIGFLDERLKYCMDYEYWLRAHRSGLKFHYVEKFLSGSRLYPGNKTLKNRILTHDEINRMFLEKINFVPAQWIRNYAIVKSEYYNDINFFSTRAKDKDIYLSYSLYFLLSYFKWRGFYRLSLTKEVIRHLFRSFKRSIFPGKYQRQFEK